MWWRGNALGFVVGGVEKQEDDAEARRTKASRNHQRPDWLRTSLNERHIGTPHYTIHSSIHQSL